MTQNAEYSYLIYLRYRIKSNLVLPINITVRKKLQIFNRNQGFFKFNILGIGIYIFNFFIIIVFP